VAVANTLAHVDPIGFTRSRGRDGTVRLAVSGELDIYTAPRLREPIESILSEPGTTSLMVDFARLDYIDCTGVSALMAGRRLAQRHGARFTVVNSPDRVVRVFTVLCLDGILASEVRYCS
jgi:anti-sigma B factor antagonist